MGKIKKVKKVKSKPKSRKELRKEKRTQKKINKKEFFNKKKSQPGQFVKKPDDRPDLQKTKTSVIDDSGGSEIESEFENEVEISQRKAIPPVEPDRFLKEQLKEKRQQQEITKKMRKRRIEQLKTANEEEDRMIRKLEKQLKIDKHRNNTSIPKMFHDGLDYALELCLPDNIQKMYTAAKEAADVNNDSDGDFQEDITVALGGKKASGKQAVQEKKKSKKSLNKLKEIEDKYIKDDTESDLSDFDSEVENDSDDEPEAIPAKKSKIHEDVQQESNSDQSDGESDYSSGSSNDLPDEEDNNFDIGSESEGSNSDLNENYGIDSVADKEIENEEKNSWEDIYGRKRNELGDVIKEDSGKYVPPHVRNREETGSGGEKIQRLRKQCKGFLNRLSEANIHKISSELEKLYMNNSRFDMNNTLTSLILESLVSNVLSNERMVLEHALLIAILHANVGTEVGAIFLQTLVTKFDELIRNIDNLDVENKELDNIVFLLSHMYTFKIFQHSLIYEMVKRLTTNLCEKSVECLLLILKSIGFHLRKDDPMALKELIILVQKKSNEKCSKFNDNSRIQFMMDILNAIKNNNINKIPQYDPSLSVHLSKILKSMLTNGKYVATLNITMEDLLKVEERGKWWIVGSAWSGNITDIGSSNSNANKENQKSSEKFSETLLQMAKQQRMNTEDRRSVFCIIMSAEDYVDAFERLLHLAIKDQRVIVSIIIHCCLSEKIFNPYYGVLAQKFCEYDRKYQLAMQFALWDKIKDTQSAKPLQITNLAQLLIYLIINGGLPVSVLKVIEFGELDKPTLRLVRQIMLGILLGDEDKCRQVFERVAPSAKLKAFKDSIRLFLHHFLIKGGTKSGVKPDQLNLLKSRVAIVDKTLETRDSRATF